MVSEIAEHGVGAAVPAVCVCGSVWLSMEGAKLVPKAAVFPASSLVLFLNSAPPPITDNGYSSLCCSESYECYAKNDAYSQCRSGCPSSWSCADEDDAVNAASTTIIILIILFVCLAGAGAYYMKNRHDAQKMHDARHDTLPDPSKAGRKSDPAGPDKSVEMSPVIPTVELKLASNPVQDLSDIVGCWKLSKIPTEILPMEETHRTCEVLFKGKHYGNRYDICDGPLDIERNDGWKVDKVHSEIGVNIVWVNPESGEQPVEWEKDDDAVPTTGDQAESEERPAAIVPVPPPSGRELEML